jgi:hypothetical protein
MKVLRTPEERFRDLPDFPFEPHWVEVSDGEGGRLTDFPATHEAGRGFPRSVRAEKVR